MRTAGPARRAASRALVRAPLLLHRRGLGGLLGRRVLLLTDVGRRSGRRRRAGRAHPLPPAESGRHLAAYARRRPRAASALMRLTGHDVDGSPAAYERVGADPDRGVPLVLPVPAPAPSGATP